MSNCSTLALTLASVTLLAACGVGSSALRGGDGKLAPCSGGPHCVSSSDAAADYKIDPISYSGSAEAARARIKAVVLADGAAVVAESADYLHATYTTTLMRYVDDVEFVFATAGKIDVRSSSRVGYADFGKNRDRVEAIRAAFAATK